MSVIEEYTDVLIVGAGPAGLTSSLALAQYGVNHVILERQAGPAHTPRAHIVNQNTAEILRNLGLSRELRGESTAWEVMSNSVWYTKLNQPEIARRESWGTGLDMHHKYQKASPEPMLSCPQTRFEPLLVGALGKAGSQVRFNHELTSLESDGRQWLGTVLNRETQESYKIRARFVIGADGAKSKVLDVAGLTVEGPSGLANAANIWFRADLSKYFAHRPGTLYWNVYPGPQPPLGLGTFICMEPFTEFLLVKFYNPDTTDLRAMSEDEARRHIEEAVGEPVDDIEILNISGWQVNAQTAPSFSSNGIFMMGDAVHRHPPTNGLGLNMSVADAFNLAWKLALVLQGGAGDELLDTYSLERQPVDAAGVQQAITSLEHSQGVDRALGLQDGLSEEEGWKQLNLLREPSPEGDELRKNLREQIAKTDSQLNALGLELGYRYVAGALVPEPETDSVPMFPILEFESSTRPGARLPHARLERDRQPISSLDLVSGLSFSLIVGLDDAGWRDAAATVTDEFGVDVRVQQIGGSDIADPYHDWADVKEVGHEGALLVRPDRYIAWRSMNRPADPTDALRVALSQVLRVNALIPAARV